MCNWPVNASEMFRPFTGHLEDIIADAGQTLQWSTVYIIVVYDDDSDKHCIPRNI